MKLRLMFLIGAAMVLAASREAAADTCTLTVNGGTYAYVARGQTFSYGLDVTPTPGPTQGPPYSGPPIPGFTVLFVGTGITGSETYPGLFPIGHSDLTGYQNPSGGGFSGVYQRQAIVVNSLGFFVCVTNTVVVELQ